MQATIDGLAEQALNLTKSQRMTLAHRILTTLELPENEELDEAWDQEIRERIEQFKNGTMPSIPADLVFAEIDAALRKNPASGIPWQKVGDLAQTPA